MVNDGTVALVLKPSLLLDLLRIRESVAYPRTYAFLNCAPPELRSFLDLASPRLDWEARC